MPYFNRRDIADAYHWFLSHYHEGQGSVRYARLCRLHTWFKPGLFNDGPSTPNALAIYNELVKKERNAHR